VCVKHLPAELNWYDAFVFLQLAVTAACAKYYFDKYLQLLSISTHHPCRSAN